MFAEAERPRLRVLIANERPERLERPARLVAGLGHDVIAQEVDIAEAAAEAAREAPDVALVVLGADQTHALGLISGIAEEAACPVITLLETADPPYVHEAARRGVFASIVDAGAAELDSAIDVALQRFGELRRIEAAFARRATIEQAKGILMAQHAVDADRAFELLRDHSQHTGRKVVDIAQAVVDSHLLLLPQGGAAAAP